MTKLYSLDVFDTLLLRNHKSEPYRFFEIAGEVANFLKHEGYDISQEDVLLARYIATEASYRLSDKVEGCREGSLEEIYTNICSMLSIESYLWRQMLQIEIEYEKINVCFNDVLWDNIKQKANINSASIILISDIYMEEEYIKDIINYHKNNFFDECSKLYSSANYTVSKASGHLFDIAKNDFDLSPEQCMHYGDNIITDYKSPKKKGWKATYLPIEDERILQINENFIEFREYLLKENIVIAQIEKAFKGIKK